MAKSFTASRGSRGLCDSCEMSRINGVACHEAGCPNIGKRYDPEREQWIKYLECPECGCEVEEGGYCGCMDPCVDEGEDGEEVI